MDVSSILGQIFNNDQISEITEAAGVSAEDTQNVLSKALPLVAGQTTQRGFNLGSLASLVGGDTGNIISSLLGAGGTDTVAQQSGVSAASTNSILSAAAPSLLSALTGEGGSGILSMLGGLVGGSDAAEKVEDTIETVMAGANEAKEEVQDTGKKAEGGFWGFISSLFGKKK